LNETKRSRKIINRIFLDNGSILLGNSHKLVKFSENVLAKKQKQDKFLSFPDNRPLIFYHSKYPIQNVSGRAFWAGKNIPLRKSTYSFSGKSLILLNGKPVQCVISEKGISVYRE
jgi:hypothetical protein